MRTVLHSQMTLGEKDIAQIKLDPKSRDDIPQLLAGLQYIYSCTCSLQIRGVGEDFGKRSIVISNLPHNKIKNRSLFVH